MLIPHILGGESMMNCLAVGPTLVLSLIFIVLYLVDQVHDLAEQLYLELQILFNLLALFTAMVEHNSTAALYGLFFCHLLIALIIDHYYVYKERGLALLNKKS